MSTQSILKNVNINKRKLVASFVNALENAESKKSKEVRISRTVSDAKGDDLKRMFNIS